MSSRVSRVSALSMPSLRALVLAAIAAKPEASNSSFVPPCIAEQCSAELLALGEDKYTSSLANCAMDDFVPCASRAWDCLRDSTCREAATCAPRVFDTCETDIWKVVTDKEDRNMLMCMDKCPVGEDGRRSKMCALWNCGLAVWSCLFDDTCWRAANCVPKVVRTCSESAFQCIFSTDSVCRDNVKCLGQGLAQCSAPGVSIFTNTVITDLIACAENKCPLAVPDSAAFLDNSLSQQQASLPTHSDVASQPFLAVRP